MSKHTTAVPFLQYGHTVPIDGKQTAPPFARYGNNRCANNFLAFVLSLAADSSCRSFLKRFVVPSKA